VICGSHNYVKWTVSKFRIDCAKVYTWCYKQFALIHWWCTTLSITPNMCS